MYVCARFVGDSRATTSASHLVALFPVRTVDGGAGDGRGDRCACPWYLCRYVCMYVCMLSIAILVEVELKVVLVTYLWSPLAF